MFGELRQLLNGEVDWVAWRAICALVDHICDPEGGAYEPGALDYALRGASRWADPMRYMQSPTPDREVALPPHGALARYGSWHTFEDQARLRRWWAALPEITCMSTDSPGLLLGEPVMAGRIGALKELHVYGEQLADDTLALLERERPALEKLELAWMRVGAGQLERLLALPHVERLRELTLSLPDVDAAAMMERLMSATELRGLSALYVAGSHRELELAALLDAWRGPALREFGLSLLQRLSSGSIRALAEWGDALEVLELAQVGHDHDELLEVIADASMLPALRDLEVAGFTSEQCGALLKTLTPRALRRLNIYAATLGDGAPLRMLAGSALAEGLEELSLGGSSLDAGGVALLAAARWPRLKSLTMWESAPGAEGAAALATPGAFGALERLSLWGAGITDAGLEALSRGLPSLSSLRLEDCQISDAGVDALIRSPMAARLRELDLSGNIEVSELSLDMLLDPGCLPNLLSLDVSKTTLADALATSGLPQALRRARPWLHIACSPAEPAAERSAAYEDDELYDMEDE